MEYILTSDQHKFKNNCLRYNFQKPIYFQSQYISLTSMIFYNYFENITDKFKLTIKNKTQSHTINFTNASYHISDISKIIDNEIKNNFNNITESKYKKLKICKYSFEISKVGILSLATGLSFLNIFAILSIILIPVIDTTKNTANIDQRIVMCKLKKDLLKESYNYNSSTYKNLTEEEINHLYTKLTNKLSVINTF